MHGYDIIDSQWGDGFGHVLTRTDVILLCSKGITQVWVNGVVSKPGFTAIVGPVPFWDRHGSLTSRCVWFLCLIKGFASWEKIIEHGHISSLVQRGDLTELAAGRIKTAEKFSALVASKLLEQRVVAHNGFTCSKLPLLSCCLEQNAQVEVGTYPVRGVRRETARPGDAAVAGEAGRSVFPAVLMAPARLLPSPKDLSAAVLPKSSRFEVLGLSSCYIAGGLLKVSAVLGGFCRITPDVTKHSLALEMCISEFRLPLLCNVSLTFIVVQQSHSTPWQASWGLSHRLCETLCIPIRYLHTT